MKTIIVSSLISLTLLNSGLSYTPNVKIKEYNKNELKQITSISDYKSKSWNLNVSKVSPSLEKIRDTEIRKIQEQKKLDEEKILREEENKRLIEEEKLAQTEREVAASRVAVAKFSEPEPQYTAPAVVPAGNIQEYAKNRICQVFGCDQWDAFYFIILKESTWNYMAVNSSSGAGGLCQALPFSKMATAGSDYRTNPNTQIDWCISYIQGRYTDPVGAKAFWNKNNWF